MPIVRVVEVIISCLIPIAVNERLIRYQTIELEDRVFWYILKHCRDLGREGISSHLDQLPNTRLEIISLHFKYLTGHCFRDHYCIYFGKGCFAVASNDR